MAASPDQRRNLISSYGLFWRVDDTEWEVAQDRLAKRRLLGRRNKTGAALRVCDFWTQSGIYVLYGNYGTYYVGISHTLGRRIHRHLKDHHEGKWDRFSWFGTTEVSPAKDSDGLALLAQLGPGDPDSVRVKPSSGWRDIEAVLFRALGLGANLATPSFGGPADQWEQIGPGELDRYLKRARPYLDPSSRP